MKKNQKITEKMTIQEVVTNFPEAAPVLLRHGLHCLGCPMSEPETIREVARAHQIELKEFVTELNRAIEQK